MDIIAQAVDPISGGAGWIGAGLLGLVLSWLMLKHLPAKDAQMKEFHQSKDELFDRMITRHENKQEAALASFRAALDKVIEHCNSEMDALREALYNSGKNERQPDQD